MSEPQTQVDAMRDSSDDFVELVVRHLEGRLTEPERGRLNTFLAEDADKRDAFVALCTHACLLASYVNDGAAESAFPTAPEPTNLLMTASPGLGLLGGAWHGTVAYFSQIGPLSYLVATVLFALGLLLGSWITVSHPVAVVERPVPERVEEPAIAPEMQLVGRITGMADCRWADPHSETVDQADVSVGRRFALSSGTLEITYDTGAKVILQGPVTYTVESARGGFLSLGKLCALVETTRESLGVKGERTANPTPFQRGTEPTASLALRPSTLFSVRTPTAVVTDLGTEFGVEVGADGATTSHVFRGAVDLQWAGSGTGPRELVLHASESARVEKGPGAGGLRLVPPGRVTAVPTFMRRMVVSSRPPKLLDLLDVVAGGNGTGLRRHLGIDPTTGARCQKYTGQPFIGDGQYRPVAWNRLIDGVFVPKGGTKVELDSAGHAFDGFAGASGDTWGDIWCRPATLAPEQPRNCWVYVVDQCADLTPAGRGLLCLHANAGITFNLEAARKMYTGVRPAKFQATAGMFDARPWNPTADGLADLRVFVDGRLKFHRERFRPQDGAFRVEVEIGPSDRFLTLVSTDGGNGPVCDWVVLGDPVLQMVSADRNGAFHAREAEHPKEAQPMKQ